MGRRPKKTEGEGGKEDSSAHQALVELQGLGLSQEEVVEMVLRAKNDVAAAKIVAEAGNGVESALGEIVDVRLGSVEANPSSSRRWADVVEGEGEKAVPPAMEKSWAEVAGLNRRPQQGIPLKYTQPGEIVKFSKAELQEGAKLWNSSLIGMVVGASPSYIEVAKYARAEWKDKGLGRIHQLRKGIYLFDFDCEENKAKVMEGFWAVYSRFPLLLKPWKAGVSIEAHFERIPIWIQLPHLDLNLWEPVNLRKVASFVGIPVTTDACTANRSRVDYARVLVEVPLKGEFPDVIPIQGEGPLYKQPVVYEWKPVTCESCGWFGHDMHRCKRRKEVPKEEGNINSTETEKVIEEQINAGRNDEAIEKSRSKKDEDIGQKVTEEGKQQRVEVGEVGLRKEHTPTQPNAKMKQVVVSKTPILQNLPVGIRSRKGVENESKMNGGKKTINRPNG